MGPEHARGARHIEAPSKTDPTDGRALLVLTLSLSWEFTAGSSGWRSRRAGRPKPSASSTGTPTRVPGRRSVPLTSRARLVLSQPSEGQR